MNAFCRLPNWQQIMVIKLPPFLKNVYSFQTSYFLLKAYFFAISAINLGHFMVRSIIFICRRYVRVKKEKKHNFETSLLHPKITNLILIAHIGFF
jgi:hypothetical protein